MHTVDPYGHYFVNMPAYEGGTFIECVNCTCGITADTEQERYRDFGIDVDARQIAGKILIYLTKCNYVFPCEESFDRHMFELLKYGICSNEGLAACFYKNICAMAELRERLKYYEDLIESGKLTEIPCKIGDIVYVIRRAESDSFIMRTEIIEIRHNVNGVFFICDKSIPGFQINDLGKTVFLDRQDAEQNILNE